MSSTLLLLFGLVLLTGGAELVVRRGSRLAARLGISPMLIGLTLVSIGTNVPELAVGVTAAWEGAGTLAVGNVAGTNTANILLVLGTAALLAPMALDKRTLRLDLPVTVAASLALIVLALDGMLGRGEALLLLTGAIVYTAVIAHAARREHASSRAGPNALTRPPGGASLWFRITLDLAAVLLGIAIIVVGSDWLVDGAVGLARQLDVSDAFIGLTVVAIGTSLPELTTAIVGTLRDQRDIAIGNVLGSCVYNILLVLGVTGLVAPAGIPVTSELVRLDIPVMTATALACIPVFRSGRRISRLEGVCFVAAYGTYLVYLVLTRT